MKPVLYIMLLGLPVSGFSQWKDYKLINDGKDTINRIDQSGKKQAEWVVHYDALRGEPGYEEEGEFRDDRKEGEWRLFSLMGDLIGIEHYKWGMKNGVAQYFNTQGDLRAEQSWLALNPDKQYDTLEVEDVDKLNYYHTVIVRNEGASLRNGEWKYYDPSGGGVITKTEMYVLGKLQQDPANAAAAAPEKPQKVAKPREVLDFEKSKKGKKVRYQDGSTY